MTASSAWTPAPRPGIIPLYPLGFGTILGRSFSALRNNPRVLLGFAVCAQAVAYLIALAATGAIAFATFSRLDTLRPGTEEWDAILSGSVLITGIAGGVLGLLATVLQTIVQGVVVAEVASATVAERTTLRDIWRRVRPAVWRLLGYTALLVVAIAVGVGLLIVLLLLIGTGLGVGFGIGLTVLVVLGAIPLTLWLTTKLALVPSALVLEGAGIRRAVARSWTLVRGRFWPALGVIVLISLIFGTAGQVVSIPASLGITAVTSIFSPTGDPGAALGATLVVTVVSYVVIFLIQSVALVVSATAGALIYIDCRMRREGLDIDLMTYVERRDAGHSPLPDPWTPRPEGGTRPRMWGPPVSTAAYPPPGYGGYPPHPGPSSTGPQYPGPQYPAPQYPAPQYPGPAYGNEPAASGQPPYAARPPYAGPPPAAPPAMPEPSRGEQPRESDAPSSEGDAREERRDNGWAAPPQGSGNTPPWTS